MKSLSFRVRREVMGSTSKGQKVRMKDEDTAWIWEVSKALEPEPIMEFVKEAVVA
jgi:hypothetical protein